MYIDSTIPEWIGRERTRFERKEYSYLPWDIVRHFSAQIPNNHFLHISTDRPGMVAYIMNAKHGEQDRQTRTKLGKYLNRYTDLSAPQIADLSAKLRGYTTPDNGLMWARTREEIRKVYSGSPTSCMTHEIHSYATEGIHPCEPYATPDVAVAYTMRDGDINSRSVVNMLDNSYVRVYGDICVLRDLLESAGYDSGGDLAGCRLLRIEAGSSYVMPYLDGGADAIDHLDSKYFVVSDNCTGEAGNADTVCGLLEDENMVTCYNCDDTVHEDNMYSTIDSEQVCEHCADNYYISHDCELVHRDCLADHDIVMLEDGDTADLDDCVYCEDIGAYLLTDDATQYIDRNGDYQYQSDDDGIVQDYLTDENILECDATEYEVDGETRYTLGEAEDDPDFITDEDEV